MIFWLKFIYCMDAEIEKKMFVVHCRKIAVDFLFDRKYVIRELHGK